MMMMMAVGDGGGPFSLINFPDIPDDFDHVFCVWVCSCFRVFFLPGAETEENKVETLGAQFDQTLHFDDRYWTA